MRFSSFVLSGLLLFSASSFANSTTYVYCALPDGSDWEWLLDTNDNYVTISGNWGRVSEANGNYFNVFRVNEAIWKQKAIQCPAGYIAHPADRGSSRWEIFEVMRTDGSSYFVNGYRTYYMRGLVLANFLLRV
ncbi:hypothetical protein FLM06_03685 [Vibrio cholerae]|uniref:Uncharacterized protein n=2 Tax=Vibrio cholerae TaxID=666 RepID=A0A544KYU7_VIBCL|nr:hypothetical protein [Vibrio cholerae]EGR1055904.1 hypothetical protein [Vibrio cholerae]EGR1700731.1 hypothetical protein [Vibrio cholerae]EGR2507703.1 hypothetical protein [Vibrio cholerae]MBO1401527.1 hypothetical protein [Vibrio cholerae]